ncbi:hypothetical protein [Haloferax sp. Atlit-16N]|uniref:hypothetical protein n=1 Tax=Haloferax sp. Atlit-16N TaxID=2077202 RepID=UPI000E283821|nr:hypothetical protein [Haloferax sp. Atlit-16N]RDZ39366.1 hypothetical protein C5B87_19545 [Haloferax sp. Atlit-16N]
MTENAAPKLAQLIRQVLLAVEQLEHASQKGREHDKALRQACTEAARLPTTAELAITLHAAVNRVLAGLDDVPEHIRTEALWLVLQMQAGPEHAAMMVRRFQVR